MKKYYLLSTDHLEDSLWFRDEEDFKVAMNYVAIQAVCNPNVSVLAFILMSNHVHFVLFGDRADIESYFCQFKHRYGIYMRRKYGLKEFLRGNAVDIRPVPTENEALERAIAYVHMNCVAANICSQPDQWPWGTGNVFFNQMKPNGKRIGDLSARARNSILHSVCCDLPGNWLINGEGYILPQEYVDVKAVENCFHTPRRMNYFQHNSSKARKRIESTPDSLPAFRDQTIYGAMTDLCRSLFHKESFSNLSEDEQVEFVRQIRFRFSADAGQIARVCGLSYAEAAKLLDKL